MAETKEHIIEKILEYVSKKGGPRSEWYVGVSKNPEKDLFKIHNVPKHGSPWYEGVAFNHDDACDIEEYLLMQGLDGDALNKDPKACGVYVYKKSRVTKE